MHGIHGIFIIKNLKFTIIIIIRIRFFATQNRSTDSTELLYRTEVNLFFVDELFDFGHFLVFVPIGVVFDVEGDWELREWSKGFVEAFAKDT